MSNISFVQPLLSNAADAAPNACASFLEFEKKKEKEDAAGVRGGMAMFLCIAIIFMPLGQVAFMLFTVKWWLGLMMTIAHILLSAYFTIPMQRDWLLEKFWHWQNKVLKWKLFGNANRFLQVVFVFVSFVGLLSLTIGMIMQEIFSIFVLLSDDKRNYTPEPFVFPYLIGLQALILHGFTCVVSEAISSPSYSRCRSRFAIAAAVATFSTKDLTGFIDEKQLKLEGDNRKHVEVIEGAWFTLCFPAHAIGCAVAWSIWSAALQEGPAALFTGFHEGFFFGSTIWFFLTIVLRLVGDGILHFSEKRDKAEWLRKLFQFFLEIRHFGPGDFGQESQWDDCAWKTFADEVVKDEGQVKSTFHARLKELRESFSVTYHKTKFVERCMSLLQCDLSRSLSFNVAVVAAPLVLWALTFFILDTPVAHSKVHAIISIVIWALAILPLSIYMVNVSITMRMPFLAGKKEEVVVKARPAKKQRPSQEFLLKKKDQLQVCSLKCVQGTFFQFYLLLFGLLTLPIFGAVWKLEDSSSISELMHVPESVGIDSNWVHNLSSTNPSKYPVCSMSWGGGTLQILDMAALAMYSYAKKPMEYDKLLLQSFGYERASVVHIDDYDIARKFSVPRVVATSFKNIGSERTTIVVAVKGTDTPFDLYLDLALYAGIAVYEMCGFLVPVMDILPNGLIAKYFSLYRLPLFRNLEYEIMEHVENITLELKKKNPGANIVMTGHSLGGGIAQMVGSKLAIETVVFSAPGSHFTRNTTGVGVERQYRSVVDIIPDSDMVPRVDRHDSGVQNIGCWKRAGWNSLANKPYYEKDPMKCHSMLRTSCELWRVCGDPLNRSFKACENQTSQSNWGRVYAPEGYSEI